MFERRCEFVQAWVRTGVSQSENRFRRDRAGEIFQSDLTEEDLPAPPVREEADHELRGDPGVDSQEADEFMKQRKFERKK